MKIEREAYEYEIGDGTMYVVIVSAHREHDWRRNEVIQPRVLIGTDPEFKAETELGHVKIRGRKYAVEHTYKRLPDNEGRLTQHGVTMQWTTDTRTYNRGFRNDKGKQIDWDSKAHGVLTEWEIEVLRRFEEDVPDWQTQSILRFEQERDGHDSNARRLREQVAKEEIEAAKWQARIDELTA
ncbi:hypothetical protein [Streptomyces sp. NPDC006879]|uniref:hypothetical protein n=1 Tax=Streptomyces sp. NPDC006879 TaxID=3364767 RepID=UPI0036A58451